METHKAILSSALASITNIYIYIYMHICKHMWQFLVCSVAQCAPGDIKQLGIRPLDQACHGEADFGHESRLESKFSGV